MQSSRRHCIYRSLAATAMLCLGPRTFAETLSITTSPPGATLEIEGVVVGTAPYHLEYPGGYFHKPHSVFGARLEHAMVLRVSKEGYLTQQTTISSGPFEWVGLTGKHHGNYFLLRSGHFDIKLEPTLVNWEGTIEAGSRAGPLKPRTVSAADAGTAEETGSVAIATELIGRGDLCRWEIRGANSFDDSLAQGIAPYRGEIAWEANRAARSGSWEGQPANAASGPGGPAATLRGGT